MLPAPPLMVAQPAGVELVGRCILSTPQVRFPFVDAAKSAVRALHNDASRRRAPVEGRIRVRVLRGPDWALVEATAHGWSPLP